MMPNLNSRAVQQMMKRMGIQQKALNCKQVIFILDNKRLVIEDPQVVEVNLMGQKTFQVSGNIHEESIDTAINIDEEDIQMVISQTNCSYEDAKHALEKTKGDIAEAILLLQSKEKDSSS